MITSTSNIPYLVLKLAKGSKRSSFFPFSDPKISKPQQDNYNFTEFDFHLLAQTESVCRRQLGPILSTTFPRLGQHFTV